MSDVLWVWPAIHGAVGGMVALSIVEFSWGGRETERSSSKRAAKETKAAMIAAIVPVGLDVDPRSVAGSKAGAAGTGRFIVAQGVDDGHRLGNDAPGSEEPDRDVAPACLNALAVKTP